MISVMMLMLMMMIVMRDCISVDSMIPDFLIKTSPQKSSDLNKFTVDNHNMYDQNSKPNHWNEY